MRLILVEDMDEDAELVLRELRRAEYETVCTRVDNQAAFLAALADPSWDVIVSDYTLPSYSGLAALADLRASGRDIPFILVSGTIGEDVAVGAIKAGAQDYVLKKDLTRLPLAVEREMREKELRLEQDTMRRRLVLSERMASAGTLAAGVAHEINNPLAIAALNIDVTAESLQRLAQRTGIFEALGNRSAEILGQELRQLNEPIRDAREALQRIREIVRDVKLFSRPDDETLSPVDLRRVADSSGRMAWNEIRHRARLIKRYADVPLVLANESRLGQVVLNLLVNAAQAIPEGRANKNELIVTTKTADDGGAVIEVSDTGCGIPPENLPRIFDPFFTTKPVGVGTGLGLAICHGIVTDLGGRIEVEGVVPNGTLFRVTLPAAVESRTRLKAAPAQAASGRARVLVVDDEVALARALRRCLSKQHDVTVAPGGEEALERLHAGENFDVIVVDVMMPEVSGMNFYERIRASIPAAASRIIFMTGGAFSPSAREFLDRVPNVRIEKPIEVGKLLALIESVRQSAEGTSGPPQALAR